MGGLVFDQENSDEQFLESVALKFLPFVVKFKCCTWKKMYQKYLSETDTADMHKVV